MSLFLSIFRLILSSISFVLTFFSIVSLIQFLSFNIGLVQRPNISIEIIPNKIIWNLMLLCIFMFQHSILKVKILKRIGWTNEYSSSLFYKWSSCLAILTLSKYWIMMDDYVLWDIPCLQKSFGFLHCIIWYMMYAGTVMVDFWDLFGVSKTSDSERSLSLNRLFNHIRHGSFTGFFLLLMLRSKMTLDRIGLAIVLTVYMYCSWRPDKKDLEYQKTMWHLKRQ